MEDNLDVTANIDMDLIGEFFKEMERQGPGDNNETQRALQFIPSLSENSFILDIGCGTGMQTMVLAKHTPSQILATDLIPGMINHLEEKVEKEQLGNRVKCMVASMDCLPLEDESFDVIWAEGSIFIIGFEKGMKEWRKFLKPGGYIAVTEACWFTNSRPKEIENYWKSMYPGIDTVDATIRVMEEAGYKAVAHFMLPELCWTDNYYVSMSKRIKEYEELSISNEAVKTLLDCLKTEIDMYEKYKAYYGYVFFIGQKL